MSGDPLLHTFVTEAREMLEEMERALLASKRGGATPAAIDAIFRAAHTIKGSSGLFGLDHVVSFTHAVESVLDSVRGGAQPLDEELIGLLLHCGDQIGAMIETIAAGRNTPDPAVMASADPLQQRLKQRLQPPAPAPAQQATAGCWHISLRCGCYIMRDGMDPAALLRSLAALGSIVAITTLHEQLPPLAQMDSELCYLGFEIGLATTADLGAIEDVFEFVAADCAISILAPRSAAVDYQRLIAERTDATAVLRAMLVQCGNVEPEALDAAQLQLSAAAPQRASSTPPRPPQPCAAVGCAPQSCAAQAGAALPLHALQTSTAAPDKDSAAARAASEPRPRDTRSIRVDAAKLDHLINLVGELIIAGARSELIARRGQDSEQQESSSILTGLVEEVRDSALQLRMVKIGATFGRFQRVVHDVSREIGKDVTLSVCGEDTELDKTVVEQIGDPLTHLIRNAIDHGIEASAERLAAGKPATGQVRLNAFHDSGAIVIQVSDDGAGLQRDRILAKAIERKLVDPECKLSDAEILNLVFEPGFSTAEQITSLSGRGVGMDVVKRNITALRGSVVLSSVAGQGTTVTVRLPLTLAIIDGFMVALGNSLYVIPLDMIEECIEFSCHSGQDYTDLRGQVLPFLRLRNLFCHGLAPAPRESIVVVKHGDKRAGLVVDHLLGEFQTVIKPMSELFSSLRCISGSTILGSGEVALILDVPALMQKIGRPAATADPPLHAPASTVALPLPHNSEGA